MKIHNMSCKMTIKIKKRQKTTQERCKMRQNDHRDTAEWLVAVVSFCVVYITVLFHGH